MRGETTQGSRLGQTKRQKASTSGNSDRDRQETDSPATDVAILGSNDLLVRLGRDESEDDEKNMWVQEQDVIFRETKD